MLSQAANYAIRAMGFIAAHGGNEPVLSRTISEKMDIPQNFLSKIMHRLVRHGFLFSVRGVNGGFRLSRDPALISLRDIVGLFMDLSDFRRCFLRRDKCDGSCEMHKKWVPIADSFLDLLSDTTIDQVFSSEFGPVIENK